MFRKRANNYRTLLRKMTYKDSLPTTKTLLLNKSCRRAQEGDKRKFEECFGPNCFGISKKISCVGTHGGHQQNQKSYKSFQTSVWFFQMIDVFVCAKVIGMSVQVIGMRVRNAATHYNTLQHTTTHCNTLQHTATHYNTLQHNCVRK